jgi:hypothetical protein
MKLLYFTIRIQVKQQALILFKREDIGRASMKKRYALGLICSCLMIIFAIVIFLLKIVPTRTIGLLTFLTFTANMLAGISFLVHFLTLMRKK